MGLPALIIGGAVTVGGFLLGESGREDTKNARIAAAETRFEQQSIKAKEDSLLRTERLNSVLASQVANAGARGFSPASPSLFSVSAKSINAFAQDENAEALSLDFARLNEHNAISNAHAEKEFGTEKDLLKIGATLFESIL